MKLRIFEDHSNSVDEEKEVYLKLARRSNGDVQVYSCNEKGHDTWCLLKFTSDGTIVLNTSISPKLGFDLNANGSIKTRQE